MRHTPKPYIFMLTTLAASFVSAASFALTINLHEQPQDQSKIVGTIDLSSGIMPIYTPKDSQWIKVADPRNGNTGWVKNSDLKDKDGNMLSFSQRVVDTDHGKQTIQTMQYGKPLTAQQQKTLDMQWQQQQQAARESMLKIQQNMDQMMKNMRQLYQQQMQIMKDAGYPVFFPGLAQPTAEKNTSTQPAGATPSSAKKPL